MPTLEFKGKPFVYAHHLSVPFRELVIDPSKSLPAKGATPSLDDNLIIHGDNLEALKALLPRYAGKVDVIYIDPPYNTGNEGWAYNDAVNSPLMKEWLGKVVDGEDLERHDKWLCMMWPRLQLLNDLLADTGVIFASIDDNEGHHLRNMMDEIFGPASFICTICWQKRYSRENRDAIGDVHEFILVYAKNVDHFRRHRNKIAPTEEQLKVYKSPEPGEPRRRYIPMTAQGFRPNQMYEIVSPNGTVHRPPAGRCWSMVREEFDKLLADGRIYFGKNGDAQPSVIRYLDEVDGFVPWTWWPSDETGHTDAAKKEIYEIMGRDENFDSPKPSSLLSRILEIATQKNSVVLDSFAGSGTTAHAVLAANAKDSGDRKFILIETEPYADTLTAERVRRVAKGIPSSREDSLKAGFGGAFTFCTLGDPIDLERFFDGETAPPWDQVARYVAFTATGLSLESAPAKPDKEWFLGEVGGYRIHLIYKPDLDFMRSNAAALDSALAERIAKTANGKPALVYAAAKFMSQKELTAKGITFCQLPYAIHRILGDSPDAA